MYDRRKKQTVTDMVIPVVITDEDVEDIMCSALEGGIGYWCGNAEVVGDLLGEDACQHVARGGDLALIEDENNRKHVLTKEKLIEAIKVYLKNPTYDRMIEFKRGKLHLDPGYIDAGEADMIIQYAIFGEIVYG